ncbi:glycine/betaine ABC transporter substrate-binding protein [Clostridium aestuarii]|uniref:Glycine/betaine ABC transporter substrate-binding protein n=1 Tax=Clostridium aestuarii TaxID=338193 RepID=A0ABT4D018_9CLOT|nr:glycine betaine ABC transporter substrate-binding protein [Clostridium aestuarii]MCY6484573.1 glycine/betaine ABC transporter substrate-binding protein [Clostridium aestuarii]
MKKSIFIMLLLLPCFLFFNGCTSSSSKKVISIGSKNFTESFLTSEMYALVLENEGFKVERKFNLGATAIAHQALLNGDIDLYPEYTGNALTNILKKESISNKDNVFNIIKKEYKKKFKLDILNQTPLNNTQAIAVTKKIAEKYNLKTLSNLSSTADNIILGCPPEFQQRPDGIVGLKNIYGDFNFKSVNSYDIGLRYVALNNNEIDATVAFTTDGQIKAYDLVVLEDDKNLWPAYHIIPVIRQSALKQYPEIENLLNKLNSLLTDETMQELNWKVDGNKREYEDVAKEFLIKNKLLDNK